MASWGSTDKTAFLSRDFLSGASAFSGNGPVGISEFRRWIEILCLSLLCKHSIDLSLYRGAFRVVLRCVASTSRSLSHRAKTHYNITAGKCQLPLPGFI